MSYKKLKRPIDYLPKNPHKAIREVWCEMDLDTILDDLEYEDAEQRENFVDFYFQLLFFVEAIYFYNKVRDKKKMEHYERASQETKDFMDSINQRRKLTEKTTLNPVLVIVQFCELFSIKFVRIELWDFFDAVQTYEGHFKDFIEKEDVSHLYLNLLTLAEAANVIFKRPVL